MNKAHFSSVSDKQKKFFLSAAVCIGLFLIAFAGLFGKVTFEKKRDSASLEAYLSGLESRLKQTVEAVDGAGKAQIFITAETSYETVYASNATLDESGDETKKAKTTEKRLAYATDREKGETPVVVKELCPKICGVWIVCSGASNPALKAEISQAVSVSLGISQTKIYVTGGQKVS